MWVILIIGVVVLGVVCVVVWCGVVCVIVMYLIFVLRDEAWLRRGVEEKSETRFGGVFGGDGCVECG